MFETIYKEWMLVTAGTEEKANSMTANWGGMGIMWHKNVAFVFIRPQRHTKKFVDAEGRFTLSFYDEQYREALTYLGRVSGKDEDKIAGCGLTLTFLDEVPAFEEANTILVCKTLFSQPMAAENIPAEIRERWYEAADYHTMYIAEIEKVYIK